MKCSFALVGEVIELVLPTDQHCCKKFPGTIKILTGTEKSQHEYMQDSKEHINMAVMISVSPLWDMQRWKHSGSRTHSASSVMCWHRLRG